ncbi:MAG: hypothetical protein K940chlam3_00599 [Chlamydiae bacterium]|nr:hypothetical protein [Chlamydiota bacterium]
MKINNLATGFVNTVEHEVNNLHYKLTKLANFDEVPYAVSGAIFAVARVTEIVAAVAFGILATLTLPCLFVEGGAIAVFTLATYSALSVAAFIITKEMDPSENIVDQVFRYGFRFFR